MGWKEELRPATFRGVPFEVDGSQFTGGRKSVNHEYPQRDENYVEDLGRATRKFALNAFVVGEDYLEKRNRLLSALEQGGPGTLIHPFYGSLDVSVDAFTVSESKADGGMASFSISFIESGLLQFPSNGADSKAEVSSLAETARAQVAKDFTQRFSLLGQPDFVTDEAATELQRGLSSVRSALTIGTF